MLRPDTIGLTALLGLLTAFGPMATDMYVPSMPAVGQLLGASASEVQLTLSSSLRETMLMEWAGGRLCECHAREHRMLLDLCDQATALSGRNSRMAQSLLQNKLPKLVRKHIISMDQRWCSSTPMARSRG
jgi:hypothetical protein